MPVQVRPTRNPFGIKTQVYRPINSDEIIASEYGFTPTKVVDVFGIMLEYVGEEISQARKRTIDGIVSQKAVELLSDAKEFRQRRRMIRDVLRANMYYELKVEPWLLHLIKKSEYVRQIFEALGSPLPGSVIEINLDVVRRVMHLVHDVAKTRLAELGLKTREVQIVTRKGHKKEVNTEWVEKFARAFGCSTEIGNFPGCKKKRSKTRPNQRLRK